MKLWRFLGRAKAIAPIVMLASGCGNGGAPAPAISYGGGTDKVVSFACTNDGRLIVCQAKNLTDQSVPACTIRHTDYNSSGVKKFENCFLESIEPKGISEDSWPADDVTKLVISWNQ